MDRIKDSAFFVMSQIVADRDKSFDRLMFLDRRAGAHVDMSRCSVDGDDVVRAD